MSSLEPAIPAEPPVRFDPAAPVTVNVAGQELTFFVHSSSLIASMLRDIDSAKSRIWLESYIFADDAAGQSVATALAERAAAGVDVRVIYDGFGSIRTSWSMFERMNEKGVKVHAFHTLGQAVREFSFLSICNRRDHRKLLIVDDRIAYFGGMNIVDQRGIETPADAKARRLPASAGWRDVHVRLAGRQQSDVAGAFNRLWKHVIHKSRRRGPVWPIPQMLLSRHESIFFFDCRPALRYHRAQRVFVPLIRKAQRNILVSMAYFIPQGAILRELVRARKRGVTIRIIIPGKSDVQAVQWATRHFYAYLLKRGFRIYEQGDNMVHSKVMVIDQEWSIVGSCNLDPRSLLYNLEFLAVIHARTVVTVLKRICRYEISKSRRISEADVARRSWLTRFRDYIAWSFRKWL
ncbi:MAG: phosphatidylserine/phosphatidylglycerophosphate/cardiolipin synthase family protein [Planctomycetia bacterium]|nr:phosphatidylserine/phosphatidylglycerophosphate/cardiolipin synthase family protein [Planctomycetia bacterium]